MYLALSICIFLILLMQLVNGSQFLNTTCILLFPPPAANAATVFKILTPNKNASNITNSTGTSKK